MKMTEEKINECVRWVEENGLYPQKCGATIKQFCEAMEIHEATYFRWVENESFANALARARDAFRQRAVVEVSNALMKAARGVDFTKIREEKKAQRIKEYDEKGRKVREYDGPLVTVRATRETVYYPPDVKAAQFVLTNLDPDNWKVKQEVRHEGEVHGLQLVVGDQETADMTRALIARVNGQQEE